MKDTDAHRLTIYEHGAKDAVAKQSTPLKPKRTGSFFRKHRVLCECEADVNLNQLLHRRLCWPSHRHLHGLFPLVWEPVLVFSARVRTSLQFKNMCWQC